MMSTVECPVENDPTPHTADINWVKARNFTYQCVRRQINGVRGLEIDDVVQNIMVKVIRMYNKGQISGSVEGLISGMVHNHVCDELRSLNRRTRRIALYLDNEYTTDEQEKRPIVLSDHKSLGEFQALEYATVVDKVLAEFTEDEQEFFKGVLTGEMSASSADHSVSGHRGNRYRRFLAFRKRIRQELERKSTPRG